VLQAEDGDGAVSWVDRQKEYESLLEEKSEVIRTLHMKIQELQEAAAAPRPKPAAPAAAVPKEEELIRLKQELEDQRRQVTEDEETLMAQMRQMEMSLSKDRAELARQRQELIRLQAEVNREIDQASRDPQLRERLMALRRTNDNLKKDAPGNGQHAAKAAPPKPAPNGAPAAQQNSGLLRRLFG
jgi:hypothetical protein